MKRSLLILTLAYVLMDVDAQAQSCPERDWAAGAVMAHECMPEPAKAIFGAHEFMSGVVRMLVRPTLWCRWEPAADKTLYWPSPTDGVCAPQIAQLRIEAGLSKAREDALARGADPNWIHPDTTVLMPAFTANGMTFTGGGLSSAAAAGYQFIADQIAQRNGAYGYCYAVHEWQHSNIQYEIFPSLTADWWGAGVWPEALAMLAMKDVPACEDYWAPLYAQWNTRWITGYMDGGERQKRQLGLFFEHMRNAYNLDPYAWMLDQHANLLAGDELAALEFALIPWAGSLEQAFLKFVSDYNNRDSTYITGIEKLGPTDTFPSAEPFGENPLVYMVANGMTEGETRTFTLGSFSDTPGCCYRSLQSSSRCPAASKACSILYKVDDPSRVFWAYCNSGNYESTGSSIFHPGDYTITTASIAGNAHWRELIYSGENNPPGDPWPLQDEDDPWAAISGCP